MTTMIEINQLEKSFGSNKAINIDSYTIAQGDLLGLVGNNGAGKTTLFRLILDLLKADHGNVTIDGVDVSRSEEWKVNILTNQAVRRMKFAISPNRPNTLTIKALDEGVVLDQVYVY